jgi:putative membrane protein
MKVSEQDFKLIERCFQELDLRTQADVALVVRKVSGNYRDIDYLFGFAVAFTALCFFLFSPWEFSALSLLLPLFVLFFSGSWLCRSTLLRRILTRERRRELQVRRAAQSCFFEKKLQDSQNEVGILVYLSTMERRALILTDRGAAKALDSERIQHFEHMLSANFRHRHRARHLATFLRSFGLYLGDVLPPLDSHQHLSSLRHGSDLKTEEEEL